MFYVYESSMSKGPGKLQQGILRAAEEVAEFGTTVEGLRWSLYELSGRPALQAGGELPTAWNTSFRRAIKGLADREIVTITSRPLASFEECVEHYPGKTLKVDARGLRRQFLPILLEWTHEKGGLGPKYGAADNEEHHLRLLPKDQVGQLEADWPQLEERLRPLYGAVSQACADDLLKLICKGRSLFLSRDVSAHGSLASWVEAVCRSSVLPDALALDLRVFLERFMPRGTAGALKSKSIIHELADVPRHGQCSLRPDTLEYLHERQKEVVEAMPGFAPKRGRFPTRHTPNPVEYDYAPGLMKFFDHTVFQNFDFIALAST